MNKAIMIPLMIVVLVSFLTISSSTYEPPTAEADLEDYDTYSFSVGGETISLTIPLVGEIELDAYSMIGFLTALVGAMALTGVRLLDSGLSERSQRTISTFLFWATIYALFAGTTYGILDGWGVLGDMFFVSLTMIYAIGIFSDINYSDTG